MQPAILPRNRAYFPASRRFDQQGGDHVAAFAGQDVVGAAGGGRVHGLDAAAPGHQWLEPGRRTETDARAAAEDDQFGPERRPVARSARRPSWSKRLQFHSKRSPREPTTTLASTRSLLMATQPGPCAVRVWTSDLSGWSFIGRGWNCGQIIGFPLRRPPWRDFETAQEIGQAGQRALRHPRARSWTRPSRWRKRARRSSSSTSATWPCSASMRPKRCSRT